MREAGLPCSVITSHGEPPDSSSTRVCVLQETTDVLGTINQSESMTHANSEDANLFNCNSLNNESLKVWPNSHSLENNIVNLPVSSQQSCRVRRQKRPYSPTFIQKKLVKETSVVKLKSTEEIKKDQIHQKPFECEKCFSPYVVNPARSHSPAKTYAPRRIYDPITKKTLLVCNACRLSVSRSRKTKKNRKQSQPSEEEKIKFTEECAKFSASLVEQLKDSDASRLYCPVFTVRPCYCLQKYLKDGDSEEQAIKAINLLNLFKKAKTLSTQKNSFSHVEYPRPRGLLKRKSRIFEEFVQEMRQYLRHKLKFCERACQRVLMYSNNFLHKQLKSAPDQGARIQQLGGSFRQQLCPISKIANENCCQDRCVLMALSHSHLLEEWRETARRSQRDARRVLAEMLTPSGGTKANCFKFIRMITGCSHTTLCLVNEQMWRTKGNREPPEHGLRRWWRQRTGENAGEGGGSDDAGREALVVDDDFEFQSQGEEEKGDENQGSTSISESEDVATSSIADIRIPTARELRELAPAEAGRRLLLQRQKLAAIQRQLAQQQRHLVALRQQRPPLVLGCCSGTDAQACISSSQTSVVQQPAALQAISHQPQLVHVLEIPATPASVISSLPDASQQQPTLSVLSSSGEFEPVTNISVTSSQPMGTVIFVPEFETVTAVPSDHPTSGNLIFNASSTEIEGLQLQHDATLLSQVQSHNQALTQIPATRTTHIHSSASSTQQPIHLPPLQFHVPLDVPIQLAVQPPMEQPGQPSAQPSAAQPLEGPTTTTTTEQAPSLWTHPSQIILPSSQPISYQVTSSAAASNSVPSHVPGLQGASTAVVNVINKDNQYVQPMEPQVYYLEAVNCATSMPD